jgi:hypothetical protein
MKYPRRGGYKSSTIETTRDEARDRQRQHEARQTRRLGEACDRFFKDRGLHRPTCSGHIIVS